MYLRQEHANDDKQTRLYLNVLRIIMPIISIVIVIFVIVAMRLKGSDRFPINTVRIYGIHRIDYRDIRTVLIPLVQHGFFNINVDLIRDQLLQIPWVADTFVRRIWPDRVEITLIEREAVAWWNKKNLLSATGELFFVPQNDLKQQSTIPLFVGPPGYQITMLEYYNQVNRLLMLQGMHIHYLELAPHLFWKIVLNTGMVMMLPDSRNSFEQMQTFIRIYPKIIGKDASNVVSVDLRYAHGMAIQWKNNMKHVLG